MNVAFLIALAARCCYRQDAAKRQTASIKFTHRPKIRFFTLQGRLIAPIHVKLGMADGHVGPLGCAKLRLNWHGEGVVGMRTQNIKNFHFLVKSCLAGANPWPISKIFMGFYTTHYPTLVFQIWHDSLHRLRSYCWEAVLRSIRPNFSVHVP